MIATHPAVFKMPPKTLFHLIQQISTFKKKKKAKIAKNIYLNATYPSTTYI